MLAKFKKLVELYDYMIKGKGSKYYKMGLLEYADRIEGALDEVIDKLEGLKILVDEKDDTAIEEINGIIDALNGVNVYDHSWDIENIEIDTLKGDIENFLKVC